MDQETLDELRGLVNDMMATEARIKELLAESHKPHTASMITKPVAVPKAPTMYRCSACPKQFKGNAENTGYIVSGHRLRGVNCYSTPEQLERNVFVYYYCGIDHHSMLSDLATGLGQDISPVYAQGIIR
jgi:hypothetical protein